MLLQHSVSRHKIDLFFLEHKLSIEGDEKGHKDRDKYEEIKRQKAIEKALGCKFIRINPDKKGFDVYVEIRKINNYINRSYQKSLIEKISKRLSDLLNMLPFCLKCKKVQKDVNPAEVKTKNDRTMLSSPCAVFSSKKSRFLKEQEAKELLSSLGIETPVSNIPLLGEILL